MPGALVGAVSCAVCGAIARDGVPAEDGCPVCSTVWVPAATADLVRADPGPLTGVVRAPVGRRLVATVLDLLVPAVLTAVGVLLLWRGRPIGGLVLALVVLVLAVGSTVLLGTGRSPGRLLLALRSVDDLTGTPVRLGRLARQLALGSPRPRFLTADLRHGRDPARPRWSAGAADGPTSRTLGASSGRPAQAPTDLPTDAPTGQRTEHPAPSAAQVRPDATVVGARRSADGPTRPDADAPTVPARARGPEAQPVPVPDPTGSVGSTGSTGSVADAPMATAGGTGRPSVGVVLESGERYDIQQVMFIGRSPVDPQPGPGRMLLAWPDLSRRVAKTHLMLEWSGTVLWVTDLESATGTAVATPDGSRVPLAPGVRFAAGIGSVISCGGRSIRVVPGV